MPAVINLPHCPIEYSKELWKEIWFKLHRAFNRGNPTPANISEYIYYDFIYHRRTDQHECYRFSSIGFDSCCEFLHTNLVKEKKYFYKLRSGMWLVIKPSIPFKQR